MPSEPRLASVQEQLLQDIVGQLEQIARSLEALDEITEALQGIRKAIEFGVTS